jgi:dienelactone hydrolase
MSPDYRTVTKPLRAIAHLSAMANPFRCALLVALIASAPPATATGGPRVEEVEFTSHGAKLSGSLVLPRDGEAHAAVVYIHGSGPQTRSLGIAKLFADAGIAAFVYDKRGVGKSGGEYESRQSVSGMNVSLLADDAAAALTALAQHPAVVGAPLGLTGISQAGWIAPLAAQRSRRADFLVMWSGPVCKVSEEDIYSKYTGDADRKTAPPYAEALAARTHKYIWPGFLGRDTDSAEDLARLSIPGVWIFGDNDASIPVDLSIARLESLRKKGHRYEYRLFLGLGHDNVERTFAVAAAWIKALPRSQLRAAP